MRLGASVSLKNPENYKTLIHVYFSKAGTTGRQLYPAFYDLIGKKIIFLINFKLTFYDIIFCIYNYKALNLKILSQIYMAKTTFIFNMIQRFVFIDAFFGLTRTIGAK